MKLLGHRVRGRETLWEIGRQISTWWYHFKHPPAHQCMRVSDSFISLPTFGIDSLFTVGCSPKCVQDCRCGLALRSPDDWWCWACFLCYQPLPYPLLGGACSSFLFTFIGFFFFLGLSSRRLWNILDMNPFPVVELHIFNLRG